MDLWVTANKIKEVTEIKHFYLHAWYYKTQKNRLVKEVISPNLEKLTLSPSA
jgi:hypothetical protein